MDNILITITLGSIVVTLYLYKYLKEVYSFWEMRGFPYVTPNLLFGNMTRIIFCLVSIPKEYKNMYRQLAPHSYGGIYMLQKPVLIIRDPELIKQVMTKDFVYFHDRGIKFDYKSDPLSRHLFGMNGQEWKALRIKLTSAFTTSRMKLMFPLMEECATQLVSALEETDATEGIEMKDTFARYATDVIGSCAFGLDMGGIRDSNSQFLVIVKRIVKSRFLTTVRALIPNFVVKWLNLYFADEEVPKFFISLVRETVEYREKNNITRNDFLDLLINLKSNSGLEKAKTESEAKTLQRIMPDDEKKIAPLLEMTIELMAAQCFLFFGAGFETTSNMMSLFFLEVAQHPQIEEKLKEEIDTVLKHNNNQLSYSALKDLKYMDMVLDETMRMYPPVSVISRECMKNYKIHDSHLVIPKGTRVYIPVIGLHHDKQYYKHPEIFTPENFAEKTKLRRHQYTYLPFGEGPRNCIAKRFAKMQMKTAIAHLIRNYTFCLSPKIKLPIEFNGFGILSIQGGIWLQAHRRK